VKTFPRALRPRAEEKRSLGVRRGKTVNSMREKVMEEQVSEHGGSGKAEKEKKRGPERESMLDEGKRKGGTKRVLGQRHCEMGLRAS